jgi:hypothetical protein
LVNTVIVVDGIYHLYYHGTPVHAPPLEGYQIGHATSPDGVAWELDPANPILTPGPSNAWDSAAVGTAAVIHDGSEFRMWYLGGNGTVGHVGYATSPDGSQWTKYQSNPVMAAGIQGSFDDQGPWPGSVIFDGELYRMWFTGAKELGDHDYDWRIGYAESSDGLSWTKHPEPVLEPGVAWEAWLVFHPSVVFAGETYHMWYSAHNGSSHVAIGYAVSPDGLTWTKSPTNPVIDGPGVGVAWTGVIRDDVTDLFSMWYVNHNDFSFRLATSDCCEFLQFVSMIPAAAYSSGAEGAFFQTDLDLSNRGEQSATYEMWWLPRDHDNSNLVVSERFTLAADSSVRYTNVLAEVFDLEPDSVGGLAVVASSPDLLAMSRTYSTAAAKQGGTYGQSIPAVRLDDFMVGAERRRILFATENDDMRFNVGCQNGSNRSTVISIDLYSADGTHLAREYLDISPWSNDQLNRPFEEFAPVNGYVELHTGVVGTMISCYGSALDNVTNDPTTILPQ